MYVISELQQVFYSSKDIKPIESEALLRIPEPTSVITTSHSPWPTNNYASSH